MATRRDFLRNLSLGGGAAILAGCTGRTIAPAIEAAATEAPAPPVPPAAPALPSLPDGLDEVNFPVHKPLPLALETKRSRLPSSPITPLERFFVRNNLPMPSAAIVANPDAWVLEVVAGEQRHTITVGDLKRLGLHSETTVLQCSGNGRAFFDHGPSGSQWAVGAAGCATWTGVKLSAVLEALEITSGDATFVTATGGEELPEGVDPATSIVERSIPIDKGIADVILAWEMNGLPLRITHGGPLRFVVPGYFGCNNIKYVKRIELSTEESPAKIQRRGYRFRPIGASGDPSQPSMLRMPVKSWVNGPGADGELVKSGRVLLHGVAFSGERGVASVEVSIDGGATWAPANFTSPDMGPNAWRSFAIALDLPAGEHSIASRATDTTGETQPESRVENERGYGYSGWREASLVVTVVDELPEVEAVVPTDTAADTAAAPAPPVERAPVTLSEEGARGREVFVNQSQPTCGTCHTLADAEAVGLVGPSLDEIQPDAASVVSAVTNGTGIMPSFKESLTEQQISDLATYIVEATR